MKYTDVQLDNTEVMIVEDNQASLELLSELMVSRGYKVRLALDGEIALKSIKTKLPDIILLDVRMTGIDGFEVCRRLKSDPVTVTIPIIFLSGLNETKDKIQGLRLGAVDYICKPYEAEEVFHRVSFQLQLHALKTRLEDMCSLRTRQLEQEVLTRKQAESELLKSRKELAQLAGHLQEVREQERTRIAREIHDELGQSLTLAKLHLTRILSKLDEPKEKIESGIETVISEIECAADIARSISEELRPGMLDLVGLGQAIESYVFQVREKTGINCVLHMTNDGEFDVDERVSIAAFRIVQESLTNVLRHAEATSVDIKVLDIGNELLVIISDDGNGMDVNQTHEKGHYGLMGMKERASLLGGHLSIDSRPGKGVRIEAGFPLNKIMK